ncbi:MAG: very short patch repair endonuclease [Oscillospiraceae bacterium]|nr:very short patch repair endonuclease [Oscillospiraceae bacterium]
MDNHTTEQRHKNMQAIKSKDSKIELILRKALWKRGLRYRKNVKSVFGKPDIAFIGKRVAVFCDSEFWHGYKWNIKKHEIHTRKEFWINKIERNMKRDEEVNSKLKEKGWVVLRFWGEDILNNAERCCDIIEKALAGNSDDI